MLTEEIEQMTREIDELSNGREGRCLFVLFLMFGIGGDFIIECQNTCNHINPNDFILLILIIKKIFS